MILNSISNPLNQIIANISHAISLEDSNEL